MVAKICAMPLILVLILHQYLLFANQANSRVLLSLRCSCTIISISVILLGLSYINKVINTELVLHIQTMICI